MKSTKKWVPIKGYEGLYEINRFGEIKTLKRKRNDGRVFLEKILKPNVSNLGYHSVTLYGNGISWKIAVHRLVAWTFLKNPLNLPTVNHKDGNPGNNCVNNLEWCSYSENIKHSFRKLNRKVWNKGLRKKRPEMICEWCGGLFTQKRTGQLFCSVRCTARRNGNIAKRR